MIDLTTNYSTLANKPALDESDKDSRPQSATNQKNNFDFSELKDQSKENRDKAKSQDKRTFMMKMHKFLKENEAGKLSMTMLPLAGIIMAGTGLVDLFKKNTQGMAANFGIAGVFVGAFTFIKGILLPKAQKQLDERNAKSLGTKISLEKDLIFDDETKKKLWVAIKQFFGYKSSLQEEDAHLDPNALSGNNMLIFHGPPGTGKTAIANGIAEQAGKKIIYVNVNDIKAKYLGESESNLANVFERAIKEDAWLFFDEADALLQSRNGVSKEHAVSLTNTFIQQYNQYKNQTKIMLATNTPDNIDPAIKSRGVIVGVKTPPKEVRLKILLQKLKKLKIKEENIQELKKHHSDRLLKLIDQYQFAGRDIESGVIRAMHAAEGRIHSDNNGSKNKLEITDLEASFAEISKEINEAKTSSLENMFKV